MALAAAIPINYLTAYHMLHTLSNLNKSKTVLVYAAAGGVGTAIIQLGKLTGANFLGITSTKEKVEFALAQGYNQVINYNKDNVVKMVNGFTKDYGADLILDSIGGKDFGNNFKMINILGQIILFGYASGFPQSLWDSNTFEHLFFNGIAIRPFSLLSIMLGEPELL